MPAPTAFCRPARAFHLLPKGQDYDQIFDNKFQRDDICTGGVSLCQRPFPFVDVDSGGSLQGMIAAQEKMLARVDEDTKIIPGHGPMANKADLQKTHDVLVDIMSQVQAAKDEGLSIEDTVESVTLDEYKDLSAFIDQKTMVRQAYNSL